MGIIEKKKILLAEISIVRFIVILLQLYFLKLYSKYTSTYDLGIYYFWVTASYSLNAFILVPLDYFQQSKLYFLKNNQFSIKSFKGINRFVFWTGIIITVISIAITSISAASMCLYIFFSIATSYGVYYVNLYRGIINNLEHRRKAIYTLLLEVTVKIGLYLLMLKFFAHTSLLIMVASLFASIVSLTFLLYFVKKMDEYKYIKQETYSFNKVFKFSYPLSLAAAINWIQLQGYRLLLVPLGFVEMVGIYGTVTNVGTGGMNAYSTIFSQLFTPNLYKTHGKYISTYLKNAFLSILFVLVCSFLLRDYIVVLLTKPAFAEFSILILFGVLAEAGNFLVSGLTVYITINELTAKTTKIGICGLVLFFITFGLFFFFKAITLYTIGLPIVITQIFTIAVLMIIVIKHIKATKNLTYPQVDNTK